MSDRTYGLTEIVGTSAESVQQAIDNAIARAATTLRHLAWYEVVQIRGAILDGKVAQHQVTVKVGFRMED